MKKLGIITTIASLALFSGCTTPTAYVPQGAHVEVTAGVAQQDMEYAVKLAVDNIRQWSGRFAVAGRRRVVNVKNITVNTTSRGSAAGVIAEDLGQLLREELTNDGSIIVYNERLAADTVAQGGKVVPPEYVLYGRLNENNVRRDNGDFYREYSLNLQLVGAPSNPNEAGLEVWQKRIPLRKAVDRKNILN